jgi:release factor glutamine methyltransferase
MTLAEWLQKGEAELSAGPHPDRARRDAEEFLLGVLTENKAWLMAHQDQTLSDLKANRYRSLIERRLTGEPVQYIHGQTEFYGFPFRLSHEVLIPRPETEHVVEKVIELAAPFTKPRIADVGTGSGAIAIALAHKLPQAIVTATDLSAAALGIARSNADLNRVSGRVRFLEGDLLAPVTGEQFEIVVSNPPYVPERDRDSLSVEVRDFEPTQALFAGEDGLAVYRRLIPTAFAALIPGGFVVLEIGYGQQESVHTLLRDAEFRDLQFTADLRGIARVASARRGNATPHEARPVLFNFA